MASPSTRKAKSKKPTRERRNLGMLTPAERTKAIAGCRLGMSLEGVAHLVRISRATLTKYRAADPTLNQELLGALAEYEQGLLKTVSRASKNAPAASQARAMLAQRFPQRHGTDPRLRLDVRAAQEGYADDLADPESNVAADTSANVIGRLVERLLREDENGHEA
jgi:hypothetical protein